jgi:hypothetical protein
MLPAKIFQGVIWRESYSARLDGDGIFIWIEWEPLFHMDWIGTTFSYDFDMGRFWIRIASKHSCKRLIFSELKCWLWVNGPKSKPILSATARNYCLASALTLQFSYTIHSLLSCYQWLRYDLLVHVLQCSIRSRRESNGVSSYGQTYDWGGIGLDGPGRWVSKAACRVWKNVYLMCKKIRNDYTLIMLR